MACDDCITHQIGSSALMDDLGQRGGFPLAGSIELTRRCNVRCEHCYVSYEGAPTGDEMSTSEVKAILDQLAGRGVLSLLITGGEIFMRRDFKELYLYARRRHGFLVTLYTNATMITDEIADFLADCPPRRIEITVYGHTAATYDAVTGVAGSYQRFRAGVRRLLDRQLPVKLKTIVLKTNVHEFDDMKTWAEDELGLSFRHDAIVNPRLDGDLAPTAVRLPADEVVRIQGTGEAERAEFHHLRDLAAQAEPNEKLFKCGAGIRTFHVDPSGCIHPCMMWRSTPYSLRTGALDDWETEVRELRLARAPDNTACTSCANRLACGNCAATSSLEVGVAGMNVDYYCEIGEARERLLGVPALAVS